MYTYTFINTDGTLTFIDADSYEEACAIFYDYSHEG